MKTGDTMSRAEWFTREALSKVSDENQNLNALAVIPERAQSLWTHIAPQGPTWGVELMAIEMKIVQNHWSRIWEYPWIIKNGDFNQTHRVLDAGGGPSILPYRMSQLCKEVISCDIDEESWYKFIQTPTHALRGNDRLSFIRADINSLPFPDGYFDRVTCVSVLEHCDTPLNMIREMIRVITPGGKLLVTMDIADADHKYMFTIDLPKAKDLLGQIGLEVPPGYDKAITRTFSENPPVEIEPPFKTELRVLGFIYEKPM